MLFKLFATSVLVFGFILIFSHSLSYLKDVAYDHYAPLFVVQLHADLGDDLIRLLKVGALQFYLKCAHY